MVNKIVFENRTDNLMGVIIEPEAVNFELLQGAKLEITLDQKTEAYDDKLDCVMEPGRMIIYECRQYEMKVFINGELEYYTPAGRYW